MKVISHQGRKNELKTSAEDLLQCGIKLVWNANAINNQAQSEYKYSLTFRIYTTLSQQ